jgi:hypothetical protein
LVHSRNPASSPLLQYEREVAAAQAASTPEAFADARTAGAALSLDQAISGALAV